MANMDWMYWPLKTKKEEVNPYGQLNPEQVSLTKSLGPFLQTAATQPAEQYGGSYTAPMTQGEQDVISQNSRLSALMDEGSMSTLLSGKWSPEAENFYQDTMYKPMMKEYEEDIRPQTEESYAGSGGYWGGARADAVREGYGDVADRLAAKRSELAWNVFNAPTTAYPVAKDWQTASAAIQSTPRLIQQYGMDKQYEEWKRTRPEALPYIDWALQFLGLSTKTTKPEVSAQQQFNDFLATAANTAKLAALVGEEVRNAYTSP